MGVGNHEDCQSRHLLAVLKGGVSLSVVAEPAEMFEKPNKGDVISILSAVGNNARQQADAERTKVERTFHAGGAGSNAGVVNYVARAVDEVHINYLKEAMSILASYLGQVDATPREMTEWAKPELEKIADMVIGEITSHYHSDLAKDARRNGKDVFHQRIDHALREFQLGRVNGKVIKVEGGATASGAQQPASTAPDYVSQDRLEALRLIKSSQFDLSKLIRLCEELNSNYSTGNYFSVAMLVRAILDHVPPIFSAASFEEVGAKHGRRSFKEAMEHLHKSSRKIADEFLHGPVRRGEVLPTKTQVYFAPALDTLLGEVAVKLR
jgi:hypothetical protein